MAYTYEGNADTGEHTIFLHGKRIATVRMHDNDTFDNDRDWVRLIVTLLNELPQPSGV